MTRTYGVRKELAGELNLRVTRWLDKVFTVDSTAAVSSPAVDAALAVTQVDTLSSLRGVGAGRRTRLWSGPPPSGHEGGRVPRYANTTTR
eukprot:1516142-Pyramimonas_sp.AAC.1